MKKTLLIVGVLVAITACSSKTEEPIQVNNEPVRPIKAVEPIAPPPQVIPHWEREGASEQEIEQQLSRCEYDVGMNTNVADSKRRDLIDACMKKEGYYWVE
ncbi:MAG: hypothetical protein Q4A74_07240 [Cardiobacteriaceae bacterium]|nr:hypothetical protein [Cardiobacteriaceae bacterium]